MRDLPSGTVTFLFTDVEGSSRLWEQRPREMRGVLALHDALLRAAVEEHGGHVVKTTGDGLHAVFESAHRAVMAAMDAQARLSAEQWDLPSPLRVRMGIHTGESEIRNGDYYGTAVNRAARIAASPHGGQIVVSHSTEQLVRDDLPDGVVLLDLGEHRLRDLGRPERLFQLADDVSVVFPPLRTLDASATNLPVQLTSFVGREREIEELAAALTAHRIVTLTGVGGVGKTRLAVQTAAAVLPRFSDGAWFVDLAPVREGASVADAVTAALGLQPEVGQPAMDRLANFLRSKELLLIVDNCEHLLDEAAELISWLVHTSEGLRVLATSREGLALVGELIVAVGSLPVPDSSEELDAAAAQLFRERAEAGGVSCLDDPEAVVQICRRLDGVPLALELAAARVRSMSLTDLNDRLDQRFRLLTGGRRDALSRHQTLRHAIDWSYDLLDANEQTVLNRCSVFAGGWDLRAAEAIVSDDGIDVLEVVDLVGHLVEKSLVVRDERDPAGRYRLLETIRQYAQEHLEASGGAAAIRRRHASHFAGYLAEGARGLEGPDEIEWATRLARDVDNLRAALKWALDEPDVDTALRLVTSIRGPQATASVIFLPWAEETIRLPGAENHRLYPRALVYAMFAASLAGHIDRMTDLAEDALAANIRLGLPDDPQIHGPLGMVAMIRGDLDRALEQFGIAADLARKAGNDYLLNVFLVGHTAIYGLRGDVEQATRFAQEAAEAARRCGIVGGLAQALGTYGWLARETTPASALGALDEAAELAERVGTPMALGYSRANAAILRARRGEHEAARSDARQAIDAARQRGDRGQLGSVMVFTALALVAAEAFTPAAVLAGAARSMIDPFFDVLPDARLLLSHLTTELGDRRVQELIAQGSAFDDDDAVAFALRTLDEVFVQ